MQHPLTVAKEAILPSFLSGGGEMGQHIREYDWSATSLGDPASWPQSLRSTLSICLNSNFPIAIYWGTELTLIYNDAWSSIPGNKHPWALGKPAKQVWPEIWNAIGPQFQKAFNGEPGGSTDALLHMNRHGYSEECYFNFTFTPIYGEGGNVEGVFNAVIETTKRVLNERQLQTLRELGNLDRTSKSVDEVLAVAAKALAKNHKDFPFGIIYKINEEENTAVPISYIGSDKDQIYFPSIINLNAPADDTKNFYKAYITNSFVVSENNGRRKNLPKGGWEIEATHFIHVPIANQNRKTPVAILSAALNPHREFDEFYEQFVRLVADQISTEVNNALAYEEERKRAELLAEIDKAKTAFFTNISHEFRTPLTLMLGSLEELLNKNNRDLARENIQLVQASHRNAVRLLRLVNNLLDFSRLESGKVKADFQLTDISHFTREIASTFHSVIEQGGIKFNVVCEPGLQKVYIDREMWEKIVLNLLSNAFKYTLKGSITISLTQKKDYVILKVKDTGTGIPDAELPKMFQRFHRVQNAAGRTYEGTGIGLSLVKELVQLHGGQISVKSKLAEGTEFTVSIPMVGDHFAFGNNIQKETEIDTELSNAFIEEANSLIIKQEPLNKLDKRNAPTVLVVDDNSDMRHYIKNILQRNFNVVTARNGNDALLKLKENKVNAVITDVMMPVMDGIQLLKNIKENPQTTTLPVILVSARAGDEAKIEGFDIGADDYLVKPFSSMELLARVRSQISLAKKRHKVLSDIYNLFDDVPIAVAALKGPDLIIEYINQHNLTIWQQSREEVLGKPLFEARPDIRKNAAHLHEQIYRTGKRFEAREVPIEMFLDGKMQTRYFNTTIDPMRDDEGVIIGQLAASLDVTEQVVARKKIEEVVAERTWELKKTNQELQRSNEDLQQFAHVASHDLKEPVRKIRTFADRLKDEYGNLLPPKGATFLDKIENASKRMSLMIDGVLAYSSVTAIEQTNEQVNLNQVIQNIQSDLELPIQQKNATIQKDELPVICGSSLLLYQLFYNLINNSLKFAKQSIKPTIRITSKHLNKVEAERKGLENWKEYVQINLKDNGIGFNEKDSTIIFKTFTRLNSKDQYEGTGLGLALCKKIVERHGGSIEAKGQQSEGAEFIIVLPLN